MYSAAISGAHASQAMKRVNPRLRYGHSAIYMYIYICIYIYMYIYIYIYIYIYK